MSGNNGICVHALLSPPRFATSCWAIVCRSVRHKNQRSYVLSLQRTYFVDVAKCHESSRRDKRADHGFADAHRSTSHNDRLASKRRYVERLAGVNSCFRAKVSHDEDCFLCSMSSDRKNSILLEFALCQDSINIFSNSRNTRPQLAFIEMVSACGFAAAALCRSLWIELIGSSHHNPSISLRGHIILACAFVSTLLPVIVRQLILSAIRRKSGIFSVWRDNGDEWTCKEYCRGWTRVACNTESSRGVPQFHSQCGTGSEITSLYF